MTQKKYVLSTLCYGGTYAALFTNNLLKSVLDPSNLPDLVKKRGYKVNFLIYTDEETLPTVANHPNFQRLSVLLGQTGVEMHTLDWPTELGPDKYPHRYAAQIQTFQESARFAIEHEALLSYWSCDMVVAKGFFNKIMEPMEKGFDAVLSLPMRACAESIRKYLDPADGALEPLELFGHAYNHMHPIFVASHWDSPQFNKLPFTILWNNGKGFVGRSFSSTPEVMRPNAEMIASQRCMDSELPGLCKNPYWATNWTDAPIVGVEPMACYYPPFGNKPADTGTVARWAKEVLPKMQHAYFDVVNYYPNFETVGLDDIVHEIPAREILSLCR